MEEMLGQVMRPPINLRSLLHDFEKVLKIDKQPESSNNMIAAMKLQTDPERFLKAKENCSLQHLLHNDDVRVTNYIPGFTETSRRPLNTIPDEAVKLQTVKTLLEEKQKSIKNPFLRTRHSFRPVELPPNSDETSERCNDLLIFIRIYRPARATHAGQRLEKPAFAEEFQCLGNNLLSELRDKISCVCNKNRFFDISNNPNEETCEKETDPGYFFITDTFYNDKRNSANVDYSETVRNWAKVADGLRNVPFKVAKMEETRFLDLTVSLGFPQLYHHHGNCEHVFTFSQIEFIMPSCYMAELSKYPLMLSLSSFNTRACNMCGRQGYVYIVEQSVYQLHDPAYLCTKCFFGFHYVDGKKVGQFKAYKVNHFGDEEEIEGVANAGENGEQNEEEEDLEDRSVLNSSKSVEAHSHTSASMDVDGESKNTKKASAESDDDKEFITIKTEHDEIV